ncbi:ComF family protein [candidate division WOR-3 bacterium]|nr:ComF family protein [candidate division WOR-3 bacterium]
MSFLKDIFNFILPPHCSVCKNPLGDEEKSICDECWGSIQVVTPPFCERCGKPSEESVCNECIEYPHEFTRARALGEYKDVLSSLIRLFKYSHKLSIGRKLGGMLSTVLKNDEIMNYSDALIAVPLYPVRERARGYNQSDIIAREVSNYTGIPKLNGILCRIRPTKSQTELSKEKRKLNVKDAFMVKADEQIKWKKLVLIDDVCTTGATLDECAKELYQAGANEVYALVVARASSSIT